MISLTYCRSSHRVINHVLTVQSLQFSLHSHMQIADSRLVHAIPCRRTRIPVFRGCIFGAEYPSSLRSLSNFHLQIAVCFCFLRCCSEAVAVRRLSTARDAAPGGVSSGSGGRRSSCAPPPTLPVLFGLCVCFVRCCVHCLSGSRSLSLLLICLCVCFFFFSFF